VAPAGSTTHSGGAGPRVPAPGNRNGDEVDASLLSPLD